MSVGKRLMVAAIGSLLLASTPVQAEDLTIALASEPTSIDPHFHNLGPNNALATHLFDRLVKHRQHATTGPGAGDVLEADQRYDLGI